MTFFLTMTEQMGMCGNTQLEDLLFNNLPFNSLEEAIFFASSFGHNSELWTQTEDGWSFEDGNIFGEIETE